MPFYTRRNDLPGSGRGLPVGAKLGHAVLRNRTRRRIREAYRLNEGRLVLGYDIVVVARQRCAAARYREIRRDLLRCLDKLGLMGKAEG